MDTSDWVELGAGLGMGAMMSRSLGGAFTDAIDSQSSMRAVTVPQTREEIETLLDKLDVRLANGEISEPTHKAVSEKWQERLANLGYNAANVPHPEP